MTKLLTQVSNQLRTGATAIAQSKHIFTGSNSSSCSTSNTHQFSGHQTLAHFSVTSRCKKTFRPQPRIKRWLPSFFSRPQGSDHDNDLYARLE
jgi:hypothetical protein